MAKKKQKKKYPMVSEEIRLKRAHYKYFNQHRIGQRLHFHPDNCSKLCTSCINFIPKLVNGEAVYPISKALGYSLLPEECICLFERADFLPFLREQTKLESFFDV